MLLLIHISIEGVIKGDPMVGLRKKNSNGIWYLCLLDCLFAIYGHVDFSDEFSISATQPQVPIDHPSIAPSTPDQSRNLRICNVNCSVPQ